MRDQGKQLARFRGFGEMRVESGLQSLLLVCWHSVSRYSHKRDGETRSSRPLRHLVAIQPGKANVHYSQVWMQPQQQIESAGRRVAIARRTVELAREDLRVQEERYQIGSATIVELQTSQLALAEAESGFVRSRQQLGVAVATLEAVLGERIDVN